MSKKKQEKEKDYESEQEELDFPTKVKKDTVVQDSIIAIILFVFGIFTLLSSFGMAGRAGVSTFEVCTYIFGWFAYILCLFFFILGYRFWVNKKSKKPLNPVMLLVALVLIFSLTTFTASVGVTFSGAIGINLNSFLRNNLGTLLPSIISFALFIIMLIILYNDRPKIKVNNEKLKDLKLEKPLSVSKNIFKRIGNFLSKLFAGKEVVEDYENEEEAYALNNPESTRNIHDELLYGFKKATGENYEGSEDEEDYEEEDIPRTNRDISGMSSEQKRKRTRPKGKNFDSSTTNLQNTLKEKSFTPPALELLKSDTGKSSAGDSKFKMNTIKKVLNQFNIPVEMGEVTVGPSVTQFTLKPAQGVNVRKILSLKDNLQMALSATNMHIEAPIPGKPFIGIEIPNEKKTKLGLRSLVERPEFRSGAPLTLAIGKDIIGKPIYSNLGDMPHLLVAGATGSGKSITLHNLILSLLYKNSPNDLKLLILDPKRVEFTSYKTLPHLYAPIIKDPKTAIKSLNWAAKEMDRRYEILGEYGVPNLGEYNKKILEPAIEKARGKKTDLENLPPKLPYIVIVFDEYNDFMLSYPKEITPVITSLTQKARAAGIHLILATQRPDVKVITGTIKANIPSRIALKTTSQIDSRTILDQAGAEDLLGNGDMLYMHRARVIRVQAPFVSSEEIHSVIRDLTKKYEDFLPDNIDIENIKIEGENKSSSHNPLDRDSDEEPTEDEDYMSAKDYVISTGKASTSALQTAFRWGYNKSARIMNDLETFGVVGPSGAGHKREVLVGANRESEVEKLERELDEMESEEVEDETDNLD